MATIGVMAHDIKLGRSQMVWRDRQPFLQWSVDYTIAIADILEGIAQLGDPNGAVTGGKPALVDDPGQPEVVAASQSSSSGWPSVSDSELLLIGQELGWEELPGPTKIKAQPKATLKVPTLAEEDLSNQAADSEQKAQPVQASPTRDVTAMQQSLAGLTPLSPPPPAARFGHQGNNSPAVAPAKAKAPQPPHRASGSLPPPPGLDPPRREAVTVPRVQTADENSCAVVPEPPLAKVDTATNPLGAGASAANTAAARAQGGKHLECKTQ
mmetsp:Transcript_68062/g.127106  ORF Transcript_68062/g.127106 Transcript_68062/m.127106 type:complete len:268 (-) Transcript_68062:166-969(-)